MKKKLLIQMNKTLNKKSIFQCISQFIVFKIFQNCPLLYPWHHTTFHVKKITQLIVLINIMNP
jgi:hypothetical protein